MLPVGFIKVTEMSSIVYELIVICLLIALNGMFALAEIAIVTSRKARLQQAASDGNAGAAAALELANAPTRFLSTIQLGITSIGILVGAFGGATLAQEVRWLPCHRPGLR